MGHRPRGCFKRALYRIEDDHIFEIELGERGRFLFPLLVSRVLSEAPHVDGAGRRQWGMTVWQAAAAFGREKMSDGSGRRVSRMRDEGNEKVDCVRLEYE